MGEFSGAAPRSAASSAPGEIPTLGADHEALAAARGITVEDGRHGEGRRGEDGRPEARRGEQLTPMKPALVRARNDRAPEQATPQSL
ncbi:hypothetical protein ACFWBC_11500 [Streptomyces sp. NPDC059985]|uniref:hypothetical protein n=1 Tax=Streptomyces sp. NPDC059985 TaxID=3347025 RepID=UPI0036B7D4DC